MDPRRPFKTIPTWTQHPTPPYPSLMSSRQWHTPFDEYNSLDRLMLLSNPARLQRATCVWSSRLSSNQLPNDHTRPFVNHSLPPNHLPQPRLFLPNPWRPDHTLFKGSLPFLPTPGSPAQPLSIGFYPVRLNRCHCLPSSTTTYLSPTISTNATYGTSGVPREPRRCRSRGDDFLIDAKTRKTTTLNEHTFMPSGKTRMECQRGMRVKNES